MSQNGNGKTAITCPHCKQRFSVVLPKIDMFNDLRSSVAVAAHEKPIRCIGCHKKFVAGFRELEVTWAFIPINDEQAATLDDQSIIVAPAAALGSLH